MTRPKKIRLGDLLVADGVISEEQLLAALQMQKRSGKKLGHELIAQGYITEDQLIDFLSKQFEVPKIDLRDTNIDRVVAEKLPEIQCRRLIAIVVGEDFDHFRVAVSDPSDVFAYDEITHALTKPIKLVVAKERDILATIDIIFRRHSELKGFADELRTDIEDDLSQIFQPQTAEISDTPVAKFIKTMFEDAVQVGASDIHIEPDEKELVIRIRRDGVLSVQTKADSRLAGPIVSRIKLTANVDISERRHPQDGRFNVTVRGERFDIRISTMPSMHGETVVMRLLNQTKGIADITQLGMSDYILQKFRNVIQHPHGMVLITGPTGSGKTTTIYSALKELNSTDVKILTVEDPVEYRMPGIVQVQVNPKIDLDFSKVLRTFLRQDPDIILVGEMRDKETVDMGLRAAMTGHLVFSTLHTNDAVSTAARLIDMGAEPYLIAASLRGILAQRLVRKLCERCIQPYSPNEKEWAILFSLWGEQVKALSFKHGKGCTYCHRTGYLGQVAVHEYLEMDGPLVLALQKNDLTLFASSAKKQPGYKTLRTRALQLAVEGKTSLEEVLRLSAGG